MTGFILTRESTDGSKRYDACWRVNGKQKSKTFTRRKQAERYLTDVVKKVQDGAYVEIKPTTFKAFAERWLEGLADLKPSTRRAYTSMLTYQLVPAFGDRPITALSVEDVIGDRRPAGPRRTSQAPVGARAREGRPAACPDPFPAPHVCEHAHRPGREPEVHLDPARHASVQITLDRYGHLFPDEKRSAATRLEAQLTAAGSSSSHPAEAAEPAGISPNRMEDRAP